MCPFFFISAFSLSIVHNLYRGQNAFYNVVRSSNMLFECLIEKPFIIIFIPGSQNSVYKLRPRRITYEPCLCSSILNGTFFLILLAFVHLLSYARTSCHVHFHSYVHNCLYTIFYVLLPYIIYVMQSGHFSQCPAFLSLTAKERDKKYSVKSPQRYKK